MTNAVDSAVNKVEKAYKSGDKIVKISGAHQKLGNHVIALRVRRVGGVRPRLSQNL